MRILWFTNSLMPPVEEHLGLKPSVLAGWLWTLASRLASEPGIELAIATSYPGISTLDKKLGGIRYFVLPEARDRSYLKHSPSDLIRAMKVVESFQADLIHVHGTERFFGLIAKYQPKAPVVVTVQGLLADVAQYMLFGLAPRECLRVLRIRDIVRRRGPLFEIVDTWRGRERESQIIAANQNFIGRTEYDRAWIRALNPTARYHHCGEILREAFFRRKWRIDGFRRHTLLFTNAMFPRKGVHVLLNCIAILRKRYPNVHLTLAGSWYPNSGWGRAVIHKIAELGIGSHVEFTGDLDADALADRLERSHAFVSPSLVENSSNSIAEAMVAGCPCVVSFVGGLPSLLSDGQTALMIPSGDPALLATAVARLFEDDHLALSLSQEAMRVARERHDADLIVQRQIEIYHVLVQPQQSERVCEAVPAGAQR